MPVTKYSLITDEEIIKLLSGYSERFNKGERLAMMDKQDRFDYNQLEYELELRSANKAPDDVPLKSRVNFSNFYALFKDTHWHLGKVYDMVEDELQLQGEAYYPIKKALCYYVESLRQPTMGYSIGRSLGDNRIHLGLVLGSGRGKGQIKKMLEQYEVGEYERFLNFAPDRYQIEQLIGRIIKVPEKKDKEGKIISGGTKEVRGYLNYKAISVDECQDTLAETERTDSGIMLEFRNAMEVWHKNKIQKKLTSENMMEYYPEGRFLYLLHYANFPAKFFDTGTARRLFVFQGGSDLIPKSAGWASWTATTSNGDFKEYINGFSEYPKDLLFTEEAVTELIEWLDTFIQWTLTHPNVRIRAIGQKHFTSMKDLFARIAAILSIKRNEEKVTKETAALAAFDTVQFLICTYEVYANNGQVNLSQDIWKTTNPLEAMLFEWLNYNKATSETSSILSIEQVQEKIGEIFGVLDRQARGIFSRLVENGKLGRKQIGKDTSRAWLDFTPELEGGVKLDSFETIDLETYLSKKVLEFKIRVAREVMVYPPSKRGNMEGNNNLNIFNKDMPIPIATLATLNQDSNIVPESYLETYLKSRESQKATKIELYETFKQHYAWDSTKTQTFLETQERAGIIYSPRSGFWKLVHNEID